MDRPNTLEISAHKIIIKDEIITRISMVFVSIVIRKGTRKKIATNIRER